MKTKLFAISAVFSTIALVAMAVVTDDEIQTVSVGALMHKESAALTGSPFRDDDISYGVAYEWHDRCGYGILGVDFTPQLDNKDYDFVITPNIGLILKDKWIEGGARLLKDYMKTRSNSDWGDIYWDLEIGTGFNITDEILFQIHAVYQFESWSDVKDFEVDDLSYGAWLSFKI